RALYINNLDRISQHSVQVQRMTMSLGIYLTAAIAIQSVFIHGSAADFPASYIEDFIPEDFVDEYMEIGGRNKRSVVFSGVEPEGLEVLNRLNNIMNNASISAESKQKLEAALGNIGKGGSSSGRSGSRVKAGFHKRIGSGWSVRLRPLPTFRPQLHATQCCCKVNVPPLTSQRSRVVTRYRPAYRRVRAGSSRCGLFGWKRCTRWRNEQFQVSYHQTIYYTQYTPRSCPKVQEVCCRGFVSYKRCCTNIREMKRLLDIFENERDKFESLREFLISQGHNPDAGCPKSCGP
ncbi:unnamed protein product, partial [Owenia fusiformis]